MRMARAMRRKAEKSATVGDRRAVKDYNRAKRAVRHATTKEIVTAKLIQRKATTEIMATIIIAMHRTFGWGEDRLTRLHHKMRVQLECLKGKYVTLEEMEGIIRDELKWAFQIAKESNAWELPYRVEYRAVRTMSAALIVSLRDEFGFGYKRARRGYEELRNIWKDIHDGKTSLEDMWAEIKRLKEVRYRWVDSTHGWWPVEGADLNDMVQKIPYVVYTPKMEEKRVPEA